MHHVQPDTFFQHSGATKGIGRAITIELATRGAAVIGTYSSAESADLFSSLAQAITTLYETSSSAAQTPPRLVGVQSNIARPDVSAAIDPILQALTTHFSGKIDIVVFNAAVMTLARMGDGGVTDDALELALAGNVKFPVMLVEEFLRRDAFRREGRVVGISSEGVRARRPNGG